MRSMACTPVELQSHSLCCTLDAKPRRKDQSQLLALLYLLL